MPFTHFERAEGYHMRVEALRKAGSNRPQEELVSKLKKEAHGKKMNSGLLSKRLSLLRIPKGFWPQLANVPEYKLFEIAKIKLAQEIEAAIGALSGGQMPKRRPKKKDRNPKQKRAVTFKLNIGPEAIKFSLPGNVFPMDAGNELSRLRLLEEAIQHRVQEIQGESGMDDS